MFRGYSTRWRHFGSRGVPPTRLRHLFGRRPAARPFTADRDEPLRFEKTLMAIWRAIQSAGEARFPPQPYRGSAIAPASTALPGLRRNTNALIQGGPTEPWHKL